ncbi:MAG: thioredoxin family protein [Anaerolineae bacterium]|nr:thioredoxin family protein [Anaerolineae bacterium]MBL6965787.1 thioredoxin family protein [Anaerolineales bacterium]
MADLLNDQIKGQVREAFAEMKAPVHVLFFGEEENCTYCDDTQQLLEEVVSLSNQLEMSVYDLNANADLAARFNVDKTPGMVLAGKDGDDLIDYGVRYAGIPSGHEFSSLINDLLRVSSGDSGLDTKTRAYLKDLKEPVLLQVFVTPT